MKKILLSLATIASVAVITWGASQALFHDTETSTGNSFTTGTIDIAVDGENPWVSDKEYSLEDMKPSQTGYIDFVVHNVGSNPANLWKTLKSFTSSDPETSEPECYAEGGTWVDDGENSHCDGGVQVSDFSSQVNYDLRVELYNTDPDKDQALEPVWWETIYMDSDNVTMDTLTGDKAMYLGMIPVNWYMKVIQSYHMDKDTGNEYQGDSLTFDIELYAEQLTNTVRLVHKYEADTDLSHHVWDDSYADFSYKVKDAELNWELATTNVPDRDYTLIVWDDTSNGYAWDWSTRSNAVVLDHLADSGDMTHDGSYDPGSDIVNAKVWLVPGTFGTVGESAGNFGWFATTTYFETGLVDFYDSLN